MITLLRPAGRDDLTAADYRDIFDELRATRSLRALVEAAGAQEGRIAYWSRYGRDAGSVPDLQARNELRALVGLPELLPTADQVVQAAIDPAAAVFLAGQPNGPAGRALLISAHAGDLTIRWPAAGEPRLQATGQRQPAARRAPRKTVNLSPATHGRLASGASAAGLTIEAFVQRLLDTPKEILE